MSGGTITDNRDGFHEVSDCDMRVCDGECDRGGGSAVTDEFCDIRGVEGVDNNL